MKNNFPGCQIIFSILTLTFIFTFCLASPINCEEREMIDLSKTEENLQKHISYLTEKIGERSVRKLWNLEKAAVYIEDFYRTNGIAVHRETYQYKKNSVANIVGNIESNRNPQELYIVGIMIQ